MSLLHTGQSSLTFPSLHLSVQIHSASGPVCANYICPCCGEIKYVPYRCHSKLCSTCGAMYSLKRAQTMQSIVRLIFFCGYMLLWFYVYSVNTVAFYDFLQPKCNLKLTIFFQSLFNIRGTV